MNKEYTRDSSFELLRLILMFLIVFHHAITHGLGLDSFASWSDRKLLINENEMNLYLALNNLGIFAVNSFVIISGYFGIRTTKRKSLMLVLGVMFYTLLFSTIPSIINGNTLLTIKSLLFISHTSYWFITDYLILMLFAPLINKAYDELKERYMKGFSLGVFLIAIYLGFIWGNEIDRSGYNFFHFIVLYAIGRGMSKGWLHASMHKCMLIFTAAIIGNMILACVFYTIGQGDLVWKTTYYSNPLLIVAATVMVLAFSQISFHNRIINYIASSSLGIYLFQNTDFVANLFYEKVGTAYVGGGINH